MMCCVANMMLHFGESHRRAWQRASLPLLTCPGLWTVDHALSCCLRRLSRIAALPTPAAHLFCPPQVRVHEMERHLAGLQLAGLVETSPGVRSVLIEYDQRALPLPRLLEVGPFKQH